MLLEMRRASCFFAPSTLALLGPGAHYYGVPCCCARDYGFRYTLLRQVREFFLGCLTLWLSTAALAAEVPAGSKLPLGDSEGWQVLQFRNLPPHRVLYGRDDVHSRSS